MNLIALTARVRHLKPALSKAALVDMLTAAGDTAIVFSGAQVITGFWVDVNDDVHLETREANWTRGATP
ncbi:MAG TPA: hypothetical protein VFH61_04565 [Thermoleophilia bacterium]|nr:hypothetical protein [Thermoleophilia bacterium]